MVMCELLNFGEVVGRGDDVAHGFFLTHCNRADVGNCVTKVRRWNVCTYSIDYAKYCKNVVWC